MNLFKAVGVVKEEQVSVLFSFIMYTKETHQFEF